VTILAITGVDKRYGEQTVLHGINLAVDAGERLVLLGPSGCGKTTLLRLVAGFEVPDLGEIRIGDQRVAADGKNLVPPQRRGVGMVFQDLALWPHMSVAQNIAFGLGAQGLSRSARRRRVGDMLARVGLAELGDRRPSALSGGQQQRVALARALVQEPRILLMDEPLSSLDIELNRRLRGEILDIQRQIGFTMVYVTHDHEEALAIASQIAVLQAGRVVASGSAGDIAGRLGLRTGSK